MNMTFFKFVLIFIKRSIDLYPNISRGRKNKVYIFKYVSKLDMMFGCRVQAALDFTQPFALCIYFTFKQCALDMFAYNIRVL